MASSSHMKVKMLLCLLQLCLIGRKACCTVVSKIFAFRFISSIIKFYYFTLVAGKSLENNSFNLSELIEKVIIHLTKVLLSVLEHHPFSYLAFIERSLQFSVTFLFTPAGEGLLFERFIIQCLNLVKGILMCAEYKPPKFVEEARETATMEAHRIKIDFFQTDILAGICRKLVTHYFLLTVDDLQLWDADPESFGESINRPISLFQTKMSYNLRHFQLFYITNIFGFILKM